MLNKQPIGPKPFYLKKYKILIILLILAIFLPGYFLLIKPKYRAYQESKSLFNQYSFQLKNNISQLKKDKQIINNFQTISRSAESKINQILPSQLDEESLYVNIQSIADTAEVRLDSLSVEVVVESGRKKITPGVIKDKSDLGPTNQTKLVNIEMDLSKVSYLRLKNLFDLLEKNLRLLDVKSFSFDPTEGVLNASLQAYYFD